MTQAARSDEMSYSPSRTQFEAVAWLNAAGDTLRRSNWGEALIVDGVDVYDALLTPLLFTVLRLARETDRPRSFARRVRQILERWRYRAKIELETMKAARRTIPPERATVLFWPQMTSHIKQLSPIAASLRAMNVSTGFLMNRPFEYESLREHEPNTAFVGRLWPDRLAAARRSAARAAALLAARPSLPLPSFLCDIDESRLIAELQTCLVQHSPSVHAAAAVGAAALDELRPDVLVVGNDVTVEGRTHCVVAKARNIPTVCPMHGIVSGEPLQGYHVADAVFVYGERSRQDLMQLGESPQRIHVCGAAHLANRKRQTGHVHPQILRLLGIADGDPWMLLATSGPGHSVSVEHHCRVIEAVSRLSVELPQVRFVAKLHPKDRLEYYTSVHKRVPQSKLITVTGKTANVPGDFMDWLQGCPAVITGGSAAGLDALLMNVPVISVDLAGELEEIDFITGGASLHARTEAELGAVVRRVLNQDESLSVVRRRAQTFLHEAFYELDGNPPQIAAETIVRLRDLHGVKNGEKSKIDIGKS